MIFRMNSMSAFSALQSSFDEREQYIRPACRFHAGERAHDALSVSSLFFLFGWEAACCTWRSIYSWSGEDNERARGTVTVVFICPLSFAHLCCSCVL
jgi:hypothetical protein